MARRGEPADFFALKGVLEALAGQLGAELASSRRAEPFLHPGRSATLSVGGTAAGWIGELHPLVCRAWDIEAAVGFEIDLAAACRRSNGGREVYEDVTTFPAATRTSLSSSRPILPAAELRSAVLVGGRPCSGPWKSLIFTKASRSMRQQEHRLPTRVSRR